MLKIGDKVRLTDRENSEDQYEGFIDAIVMGDWFFMHSPIENAWIDFDAPMYRISCNGNKLYCDRKEDPIWKIEKINKRGK